MYGASRRVFKNAPRSLREQWLATAAHGDRPYFIYNDETTTYADAHRMVNSLAAWLVDHGIGKGDRVGIRVLEDGKKVRFFKSNGELVKA